MFQSVFELLSNVIFQTSLVEFGGNFPMPLSKEEEARLLEKNSKGDKNAREELVKHNMRLVVHVVKKYNNYYDTDELISVGSIGLVKAVDTYDYKKGTGLATYAARCIENEILMVLRSNKKRQNDMSIYEPLSYDKEGNEMTLSDLLSTEDDSVAKVVEDQLVSENIKKALHTVLDGREMEIIILRYGLDGNGCRTQKQVAKEFDISRSYVSRIEKKALGKLKEYLESNELV